MVHLYSKNVLKKYTFGLAIPFEPEVASYFVFALLRVCALHLCPCDLLVLLLREVELEDLLFLLCTLFLRLRRSLRDLVVVLLLSEVDDLLLLMLLSRFVCLRRRLLLLDAELLLLLLLSFLLLFLLLLL